MRRDRQMIAVGLAASVAMTLAGCGAKPAEQEVKEPAGTEEPKTAEKVETEKAEPENVETEKVETEKVETEKSEPENVDRNYNILFITVDQQHYFADDPERGQTGRPGSFFRSWGPLLKSIIPAPICPPLPARSCSPVCIFPRPA